MTEELFRELHLKIESAFSETQYPGDDKIGRYEVSDFRGHWKSIPIETIIRHRDELAFFSPEGFRYYLPAFLLAIVLHFDNVDTLPDSIINSLSPPDADDAMKMFVKRMSLFDPQEKSAIRAFFEAYKRMYPYDNWSVIESEGQKLEKAIDFWQRY